MGAKSESKIIPNTAYRLNTAYIVAIASRNACMSTETNTRTITWNAFIQRGGRKSWSLSKRWNAPKKIFLPTLSETSDGIHTLSWNILVLYCLTIFSPHLLRRKVLLHNEASHVHCFNTMIDPCQCLLLKLTLTIYA